jgi:hypothetical protein
VCLLTKFFFYLWICTNSDLINSDAVKSCKGIQTFRRNILPPSAVEVRSVRDRPVQIHLHTSPLHSSILGDGSSALLRNIDVYQAA